MSRRWWGLPLFAFLVVRIGWRYCFLLTPVLCVIWLVLWLSMYRNVPKDESEKEQQKIGWAEALTYPATWGFALAKFFSDPVWWFYLFWLPPYFYDVRKLSLTQIGWALPVIYLMADVGSVGGWLSGYFMRLGWPQKKSRLMALAIFACMMPFAATSVLIENPFYAIALVSLATSAHQGWSANLYTTVSRFFPEVGGRISDGDWRLPWRSGWIHLLGDYSWICGEEFRVHTGVPQHGLLPSDSARSADMVGPAEGAGGEGVGRAASMIWSYYEKEVPATRLKPNRRVCVT